MRDLMLKLKSFNLCKTFCIQYFPHHLLIMSQKRRKMQMKIMYVHIYMRMYMYKCTCKYILIYICVDQYQQKSPTYI